MIGDSSKHTAREEASKELTRSFKAATNLNARERNLYFIA